MTSQTSNTPVTTSTFAAIQMHHATRAKAERLFQMLGVEYPGITMNPVTSPIDHPDFSVRLTGWSFSGTGDEGVEFLNVEKTPEIADVLEAAEAAGIDPEAGADEELLSHSIVADAYRRRYRETSSTKQSCGDWLAEWLAQAVLDADGKFMPDEFYAILSINGVDTTASWAVDNGTRGWRGRYRMTGRLILEKNVARQGYVLTPGGTEVRVPSDDLEVLRDKHAKWIAKQDKIDAAMGMEPAQA